MNGVGLHSVPEPGREVPFGIGPAYNMRHINRISGLVRLNYLTWCFKIVVRMLQDLIRQVADKIKNTGISPLMLPKCLIIHKEVNHIAVAIYIAYPSGKFICRQRPLRPVTVGKSKGNVVAE